MDAATTSKTTAATTEKEMVADVLKKPVKKKPRLIVRIGSFLVSHSLLFSVVSCSAGLIALLLLPVLAKNTYISENALLPGSANPMFSAQDVFQAQKFARDIMHATIMTNGKGVEIPRLIGQQISDVGAEVYHHMFNAPDTEFHPLNFFSCNAGASTVGANYTCSLSGVNTVGIIRAPRGDGKEAIVLVTPYNSQNIQLSEALSLGLAYSIFSFFRRVTWLAKDIVWLAADSQYGDYAAVAAWLTEYHNPVFLGHSGKLDFGMCSEKNELHPWHDKLFKGTNSNVFKRSGTMAAALVVRVMENKERSERDRLDIYAEALNGQMPNLDLINTVHFLAVHRQGLRVMVRTISSLLNSSWLKLIGDIVQRFSKLAKTLNPKWKFETTSSDFVEGTATLASSIYHQALGVPTGSHGAFREYQVDALTLELSPWASLNNENVQSAFILRSGRLIEGVVRSVNNLLEKFHQSFFLYFLTAPNKFVSVGVYMIPFALLVAPLPIVAAALFSARKSESSNSTAASTTSKEAENESKEAENALNESSSWKWLHAAKVVLMIHLWAGIVSLLPYQISELYGMLPTASMVFWVVLSIAALLILYQIMGSLYLHSPIEGEWRVLKSMTIAGACIGLSLMSIINFSTALIGAMFVVPMCLVVRPFRLSKLKVVSSLNLLFGIVGFPPAGLLMMKGMTEGFSSVSVGDFWEWVQFLWSWNSATYVYLLLVHLPCWVLCMTISMHS